MTFELGLVMAAPFQPELIRPAFSTSSLRLWTHTKKRRGSWGGAVRHTMSECL
jgi:hypothetical protein